jgi:hypothetical protein
MRRLFVGTLLLVHLWGCASKKPETSNLVVPMSYFYAASALAVDDFGRAREFLKALASESGGDLKTQAQAAAAASDIESMRAFFKGLTEGVVVNLSYPDGYAVAFCPMYKNGSKWIQKREAPIANPYFGKSVPTCGSFVD